MELIKNTNVLFERYQQYKLENPKIRIREAAKDLGVTELDLVNCNERNIQLHADFNLLLNDLGNLKEILAITRNEYAVHERKGIYTKATISSHIGLVVNPDIDLRLFMANWKYAYAVEDNNRNSIQFFDKYGIAIHKVYLTENSDRIAYQKFLEKHENKLKEDLSILPLEGNKKIETPDVEIDVLGFQAAWKDLKDTHDFFPMLRDYKLSRLQALRLAPENYSHQIPSKKIESLLNLVSSLKLDIMVFVGNNNCLQIHTGPIDKIVRTGPWLNVLDPIFNLHLKDEAIDQVWIVKKPTDMGLVHSVEAFDKDGNLIIQFFGKRKPNIPESEDWRLVIQSLENVV